MTTTTERSHQPLDQAPPGGTIVVGIDGSDSSLQALAWGEAPSGGRLVYAPAFSAL